MYHKEPEIQKLLVIFIYVNFYLLMATNSQTLFKPQDIQLNMSYDQ